MKSPAFFIAFFFLLLSFLLLIMNRYISLLRIGSLIFAIVCFHEEYFIKTVILHPLSISIICPCFMIHLKVRLKLFMFYCFCNHCEKKNRLAFLFVCSFQPTADVQIKLRYFHNFLMQWCHSNPWHHWKQRLHNHNCAVIDPNWKFLDSHKKMQSLYVSPDIFFFLFFSFHSNFISIFALFH